MITAQQFWERWQNGMNQSADRMRMGVQAVTENPMERAHAAIDKMRAKWLASVDNGDWGMGVLNVSLQQWQQAMVQKGIPRIADGVRGAQNRVTNFAQQLLQYESQLQAQIRAMPKITPADSRARMNAWFDGMQRFEYIRQPRQQR